MYSSPTSGLAHQLTSKYLGLYPGLLTHPQFSTQLQGDTQIPTLTGGVVRDLDWTIEVLVKKSHKSETHSDFPGCLKKRRFSPANLCVRNFPRASPGWEIPPPLPPAQITIEL